MASVSKSASGAPCPCGSAATGHFAIDLAQDLANVNVVLASPGRAFEEWVGIETWKRLQYRGGGQLHHFRTKDGAEVDFIVDLGKWLIPIEVKWTERPSIRDVPQLVRFVKDHRSVKEGYVICRVPRPARLSDSIVALPWQHL